MVWKKNNRLPVLSRLPGFSILYHITGRTPDLQCIFGNHLKPGLSRPGGPIVRPQVCISNTDYRPGVFVFEMCKVLYGLLSGSGAPPEEASYPEPLFPGTRRTSIPPGSLPIQRAPQLYCKKHKSKVTWHTVPAVTTILLSSFSAAPSIKDFSPSPPKSQRHTKWQLPRSRRPLSHDRQRRN